MLYPTELLERVARDYPGDRRSGGRFLPPYPKNAVKQKVLNVCISRHNYSRLFYAQVLPPLACSGGGSHSRESLTISRFE